MGGWKDKDELGTGFQAGVIELTEQEEKQKREA